MSEKNPTKGCLILNVTNITESNPVLSSEIETDGPNIEDAYL